MHGYYLPVDNYLILNQNNINPTPVGLAVIAVAYFQTPIGWVTIEVICNLSGAQIKRFTNVPVRNRSVKSRRPAWITCILKVVGTHRKGGICEMRTTELRLFFLDELSYLDH
jgi:hypothetical protein